MIREVEIILDKYGSNTEMIQLFDKSLNILNELQTNTAFQAKNIAQKIGVIDRWDQIQLSKQELIEIQRIDLVLSELEKCNFIEGISTGPIYNSYYILQEGKEFLKANNFNSLQRERTYSTIVDQNNKDLESQLLTKQTNEIDQNSTHRKYRIVFWIVSIAINLVWLIYNLNYKCS